MEQGVHFMGNEKIYQMDFSVGGFCIREGL